MAKSSALSGIESVRLNSQIDSRFNSLVARDDSPYFVLKAGNGEIIGKSEMYSSASAMKSGIASVKANALDASIVDVS